MPVPPEAVPASEPPPDPVAGPDELAPDALPVAEDDAVPAPNPVPVSEDVPVAGADPLLGSVVPEELGAPALLADEELPPVPPELAEDEAAPPEQAMGPRSVNKGSSERRCRPMAMVVLALLKACSAAD
ncbi:MAG: hypothetical protein ABSC94_29705 [Polyangiaceae bacterium]|jgi:hypothetical protein